MKILTFFNCFSDIETFDQALLLLNFIGQLKFKDFVDQNSMDEPNGFATVDGVAYTKDTFFGFYEQALVYVDFHPHWSSSSNMDDFNKRWRSRIDKGEIGAELDTVISAAMMSLPERVVCKQKEDGGCSSCILL